MLSGIGSLRGSDQGFRAESSMCQAHNLFSKCLNVREIRTQGKELPEGELGRGNLSLGDYDEPVDVGNQKGWKGQTGKMTYYLLVQVKDSYR